MASLGALLRRGGFVQERWYSAMGRRLDELPVAPVSDGVRLVAFIWDRDEEVRRAHNASFTAHHGSAERDTATWQTHFTGQRAFRPDLSVVALEDGAVVGYALAYVYEADSLATGYDEVHLGQIGVLPSARGRGVASAVIAEVLVGRRGEGARTPGSGSTPATSPARCGSTSRWGSAPSAPRSPGHWPCRRSGMARVRAWSASIRPLPPSIPSRSPARTAPSSSCTRTCTSRPRPSST